MSRPLRIEVAGGCYHVTSRGNERREIYREPADRLRFLELVADCCQRFQVWLWGYILMDNHYHLGVETPEANLSRAMQWLNGSYSIWFNRRYRRSGHLFQGRFRSVLVDWEQWGVALARYLHLNPIRVAGMGLSKREQERNRQGVGGAREREIGKQRLELLSRYRWSSYRATIGQEQAPEWLKVSTVLAGMKGSLKQRQREYQRYVETGVLEGLRASPWEALSGQVVLGSQQFREALEPWLEGNAREQVGLSGLRWRPEWKAVVRQVEAVKGEKWEAFVGRSKDWGRDLALYLGRTRCGLKLRELGELAGGIDYATVSNRVKGFQIQLEEDAALKRLVRQIEHNLENRKI